MFFPSLRPVRRPASRMFPPSRRPVPGRKGLGFRPGLEALESRWVPTTVTNLDDAGAGSLRQAILDTPAGGTVDFQPGLSGTITLTTGELAIAKNLTVAGPGAGVIAVSGNNASRVFSIAATFTVTLSGLTITGGRVTELGGGGIYNGGALTVTGSTISGNSGFGGGGGGIYNAGTLTVSGSILNGNSALFVGGGIFNSGGTVTVTASTLSGNSATRGGGIENNGTLTVTTSTLSGNSVEPGAGGGIINWGMLTVTGSTITGNTGGSVGTGGGIRNVGTLILRNTIVAGNAGRLPDVSGTPINSQGHNLIGDSTGGTGFHETDLVGTPEDPIDPLLGPLQANSGPTFTHALLPGSPAINAGDNADPPATDQRGAPRIIGGTIDIGAFEAQPTRTWIGGAYLDVCAGTHSGDSNAWSNPLNWLGGLPSRFDTVAFTDRVLVAQCSGTDIYGPFTTSAVVDAAFAGTVWGLDSAWAGTITLGRELTLTGSSRWSGGTLAGSTLTNAGVLTVSGGTRTGNLSNLGTILLGVTGSGQSFLVDGAYAQTGTLLVGPDSTFRVTGTYSQQTNGITYLLFGTLTAPLIDLAAGSSLMGSGTLTGNVRNAGWASVGDYGAAGYLIVNGDYTQTGTGGLILELGSLVDEDYDVMVVTGTASLDGVIYVGLLESFTPEEGAGYAVLWFGTRGPGEPAVYLPDLGPDFYFEPEFADSYLALWLWRAA